jgi:hypothetical protein
MATGAHAASVQVWKFDNLNRIDGLTPKIEGQPQLVDGPLGKAVQFNGKDTALFFDKRPLVGAKTFTIEGIFRPEGSAFEQRWMHVAETDPATGLDTGQTAAGGKDANSRYMFEIRVKDGSWYLDGFVQSKAGTAALLEPTKTHPVGPWYAVAQTYDGTTYRTYVNGELQAEAPVAYAPHGPGHVMIGTRINRVNYFQGSVAELRFSDFVRKPSQMLKVPPSEQ